MSYKMALISITSMCILLKPLAAFSDDLSDGYVAYKAQNYSEAMRLLQPLIINNDPKAELIVGEMYESGRGVAPDYNKALELFYLSAAQGNYIADFEIGFMYQTGVGVTKNTIWADKWMNLALKGEKEAQAQKSALDVPPPLPPADNYLSIQSVRDENEYRMMEMEQKQQEIQATQREMQSKMEADEIYGYPQIGR